MIETFEIVLESWNFGWKLKRSKFQDQNKHFRRMLNFDTPFMVESWNCDILKIVMKFRRKRCIRSAENFRPGKEIILVESRKADRISDWFDANGIPRCLPNVFETNPYYYYFLFRFYLYLFIFIYLGCEIYQHLVKLFHAYAEWDVTIGK